MALPQRWVVLSGLFLGRIVFGFGLQSMAVVAPGVAEDLSLDTAEIGTLIGFFMLPGVVLALPGGLLAHWFGEWRVITLALIATTAGAALSATGDAFFLIAAGRLLCGMGAIVVTVVMTKVVIDWFAQHEMATAMGIFLAGYPAGMGLALVTLGPLATAEDWRLGLYACASLSFVCLLVFWVTYRPVSAASNPVPTSAKLNRREIGMVTLSATVGSLYNGGYLIMLSFVPLYLIGRGLTPAEATAAIGVGVWVSIAAVPLGGALADWLRRPNLIMVAGACVWGTGTSLVPLFAEQPGALWVIFGLSSLIGAIPVGVMISLSAEVMRPQVRGVGTGLFYTWFYGVAAAAPAFAGFVINQTSPLVAIYLTVSCAIATIFCLLVFRVAQRLFPRVEQAR